MLKYPILKSFLLLGLACGLCFFAGFSISAESQNASVSTLSFKTLNYAQKSVNANEGIILTASADTLYASAAGTDKSNRSVTITPSAVNFADGVAFNPDLVKYTVSQGFAFGEDGQYNITDFDSESVSCPNGILTISLNDKLDLQSFDTYYFGEPQEIEIKASYLYAAPQTVARNLQTEIVITVSGDKVPEKPKPPVAVPTLLMPRGYGKINGARLTTVSKNLTIDNLFDLSQSNGVNAFNSDLDNPDNRISISVTKNGEEYTDSVFVEGEYVFTFGLPIDYGVTWEGGSTDSLNFEAVLGAPLAVLKTVKTQTVYKGSEYFWTDFISVTSESRFEENFEVTCGKILNAGEYEIKFSPKTESAFLELDGELCESEGKLNITVLKALADISAAGCGVYTGLRQSVADVSVTAMVNGKVYPEADLTDGTLSFFAGSGVVDVGEYKFVSEADNNSDKSIIVKLTHKNYELGAVEGVYAVTPALISALLTENRSTFSGADHMADTKNFEFTGLVNGESLSEGEDYAVSVFFEGEIVGKAVEAGVYSVILSLNEGGRYTFAEGYEINLEYEIEKACISLEASGAAVYTGEIQELKTADVKAEFYCGEKPVEIEDYSISFMSGVNVKDVRAEGYNFVCSTPRENEIQISFTHKNYKLSAVSGVFMITPATLKVNGSAAFNCRYTGEIAEISFNSSDSDLSLPNYALEDGADVTFRLATADGAEGVYSYSGFDSKGLRIGYTVHISETKAANYLKENGEFKLDFENASFTVKIVKPEIVSLKWYLVNRGYELLNVYDSYASRAFDGGSYLIAVDGKYSDENGEIRNLSKDELAVTIKGLTPYDDERLVTVDGEPAIRNTGSYTACINTDLYKFHEGCDGFKLVITPYAAEVAGHGFHGGFDLLYGERALKNIFGGEYALKGETIRISYTLDATRAQSGFAAEINMDGFVDAGEYSKLIPQDVEIISNSPGFDVDNYEYIYSGNYTLRIAPVKVVADKNYFVNYIGYLNGEEGNYTAEKIQNEVVSLGFAPDQPDGLALNVYAPLPGFAVEFKTGKLISYGGALVARNAGEYEIKIILNSPNYAFGPSESEAVAEFKIERATIETKLDNAEETYNAQNRYGGIKTEIYDSYGNDISRFFFNADNSAIKTDGSGVFGVPDGEEAFKLNFYYDSAANNKVSGNELVNAGTYYGRVEFNEFVAQNFIVHPIGSSMTFKIKKSKISLDIGSLEFTEDSELFKKFSGLGDYLIYGGNIKTLSISFAAEKAEIVNGVYKIPFSEIFGEARGFYGSSDNSYLEITLISGNVHAGVCNAAVEFCFSENYESDCDLKAVIEITPKPVEAEWSFGGVKIENSLSLVYNGLDRLKEIKAAAYGIEGTELNLSPLYVKLFKNGKEYKDFPLSNAGEFAIGVNLEEVYGDYIIINDSLKVIINPYTVSEADMRNALVWRNASASNALLQSGEYFVEGLRSAVSAENAFVGHSDGVTNRVIMNTVPELRGTKMFETSFTGDSGEEYGRYELTATLTPTEQFVGELKFNNFKWLDGYYCNLRENESYGETITFDERTGNLIVVKIWYIVDLNNGLLKDLGLPEKDMNGDGKFDSTDGDLYGWQFGESPEFSEYPLAVRNDVTMILTLCQLNGSLGLPKELIADVKVVFKPGKVDETVEKITDFIDYWLNSATPAGNYSFEIYIERIVVDGGAEYLPFERTYYFTVLPAPIRFDSAALEDFSVEYDGNLHFFKDGNLPVFDNMDGEKIEALRRGTGWVSEDFDCCYGKIDGRYLPVKLLISDSPENGYHDINDKSDSWNSAAENGNLPLNVKAVPYGDGFKEEPYTIFYKIKLKNHDEYITDGSGRKHEARECFYRVEITPRNLRLQAVSDDRLNASGDEIRWQYGSVQNFRLKISRNIAENGLLGGGDTYFEYAFIDFKEFEKLSENEKKNLSWRSAFPCGGELEICVPDEINEVTEYVLLVNVNGFANKGKPNGFGGYNYSLAPEGCENIAAAKIFHVYVGLREVGSFPESGGFVPIPEEMLEENGGAIVYSGNAAAFRIDKNYEEYFGVFYSLEGDCKSSFVNAGEYSAYVFLTDCASKFYRWPDGVETVNVGAEGRVYSCLKRSLRILPKGVYITLGKYGENFLSKEYNGAPSGIRVWFTSESNGIFTDITEKFAGGVYIEYLQNGNSVEPVNAGKYAVKISLIQNSERQIYTALNYYIEGVLDFAHAAVTDFTVGDDKISAFGFFSIYKAVIAIKDFPDLIYNGDSGRERELVPEVVGNVTPTDEFSAELVGASEMKDAGSYAVKFTLSLRDEANFTFDV